MKTRLLTCGLSLIVLSVSGCFVADDADPEDSEQPTDSETVGKSSTCLPIDPDSCETHITQVFQSTFEATSISPTTSFIHAHGELLLAEESTGEPIAQPIVYTLERPNYDSQAYVPRQLTLPNPLPVPWTVLGLTTNRSWIKAFSPYLGFVSLCRDDEASCYLWGVPHDPESSLLELIPGSEHTARSGHTELRSVYSHQGLCLVDLGISCFDGELWTPQLKNHANTQFYYFNEHIAVGEAGAIAYLDGWDEWHELTIATDKDLVFAFDWAPEFIAISEDGTLYTINTDSGQHTECPLLAGPPVASLGSGDLAWVVFDYNQLAKINQDQVCTTTLPNEEPILAFTAVGSGTCSRGRLVTQHSIMEATLWCTE